MALFTILVRLIALWSVLGFVVGLLLYSLSGAWWGLAALLVQLLIGYPFLRGWLERRRDPKSGQVVLEDDGIWFGWGPVAWVSRGYLNSTLSPPTPSTSSLTPLAGVLVLPMGLRAAAAWTGGLPSAPVGLLARTLTLGADLLEWPWLTTRETDWNWVHVAVAGPRPVGAYQTLTCLSPASLAELQQAALLAARGGYRGGDLEQFRSALEQADAGPAWLDRTVETAVGAGLLAGFTSGWFGLPLLTYGLAQTLRILLGFPWKAGAGSRWRARRERLRGRLRSGLEGSQLLGGARVLDVGEAQYLVLDRVDESAGPADIEAFLWGYRCRLIRVCDVARPRRYYYYLTRLLTGTGALVCGAGWVALQWTGA